VQTAKRDFAQGERATLNVEDEWWTMATFAFTDPGLANWPLAEKQAEVQKALAAVPDDTEAVARYDRWARELAAQLKLLRIGSAGAIMAEADAVKTIADWERGLPSLKLQALLNEI
jgi:hypothetical protein